MPSAYLRIMTNQRTTRAILAGVILSTVALSMAAPAASAQAPTDIKAPSPGKLEPPSPLMSYIAAFILAGGALALTAMPSRRTHQD